MKKFQLEILASDKTFYKGDSEEIILPSINGLVGILADHWPMVVAVNIGEIRFKVDGEWHKAVVSSGMAEVMDNKVILLVDTAERPEDIDIRRAEEAKQRAEERLSLKLSKMEYHQSKAALARAMSRLSVTNKRGQ
ncbi:ATP synthase F1 subunit epsilon [Parasporobacterium paucivorans]|uniref:ATP synthase epsilon chain n=1 Tax=Parasporobacterium paucivorans DSM 15970 TaxID=1122934 RepID=A0A1M6FM19_9FIRM|nr:ATP synthase F1 subunit epsilon [Parasporobacterium paucivorans]SHI98761.1 ATP synthase F1 subcomplex epsilon subunit [Parasporobacterium paucivorans DSM 15970]